MTEPISDVQKDSKDVAIIEAAASPIEDDASHLHHPEDEVLHIKIREVAHKSLRRERKSLKHFRSLILDQIPTIANLHGLTHKDIITELLKAMWEKEENYVSIEDTVDAVITSTREDGTEVWYEMIEGRGFVVVLCEFNGLDKNEVALGRLRTPLNLSVGGSERSVRFVGLAVGPPESAAAMTTRTVFETGRSLASILSEPAFRLKAEHVHTDAEFLQAAKDFLNRQEEPIEKPKPQEPEEEKPCCAPPFTGLISDFKRRIVWYPSDFTEAMDYKAKVLSTAVYLLCIILAPAIAFGELMNEKTHGQIGPVEILVTQSVCGLLFALFGGCPFVIIMTTGPLTVFIGIIYKLADSMDIPFLAFYGWVGIWNVVWLLSSVFLNLSDYFHYVTAFVDQIFGCLVAGIFVYEGLKPTIEHFFWPSDGAEAAGAMGVVLVFGTFIAAVHLVDLRTSKLLTTNIREVISDYGTAIAMLLMTGVYHLAKVSKVDTLDVPDTIQLSNSSRDLFVDLMEAPLWARFAAAGPGFLLFTLFFIDQNVTSILSNKKEFKLRKGDAKHWDLFVVACLNIVLSLIGFPFLHGALPQSPLHVMQLAEHEEFLEQGVLRKEVVKSRETRLTGALCHIIMAGVTAGALPALRQLPVPVLHGVFITMAYQGAKDNPFVDRILLWFTELSRYPPTHLVRRVRLRTISLWTLVQLVSFGVLWGVKSSDAAIAFPFVIVTFVLFRQLCLPRLFSAHDMELLEE
eukprot:TRINITY_DN10786_c1_g1_i1.p1 TRINITY_DN10786_c1_g1~~TRINITY_DN10786_c1_g1_i1.p1  ORF type:complete len:755 (+),score=144.57 TRINITY_DN10786_c1_g1_i1:40-2265(+)